MEWVIRSSLWLLAWDDFSCWIKRRHNDGQMLGRHSKHRAVILTALEFSWSALCFYTISLTVLPKLRQVLGRRQANVCGAGPNLQNSYSTAADSVIDPMLFYSWASSNDAGPTWEQQRVNVSFLLQVRRSDAMLQTITQSWLNVGPPSATLAQH